MKAENVELENKIRNYKVGGTTKFNYRSQSQLIEIPKPKTVLPYQEVNPNNLIIKPPVSTN